MLSPPYSPHTDLVDDLAGRRLLGKILPLPSHNQNNDDLTDTDDVEFEENSGSVPPHDHIIRSKRSASDAFSDDSDLLEDSLVDSNSRSTSVTPTSSRPVTPPYSSVKERRMTTCWDALKTNPAKYLRQERSLLELYPLRRHSWAGPGSSGFGSDDNESTTGPAAMAASAVSSLTTKPGSGRGRGRRAGRSSSAQINSPASSANRARRRGGSPELNSSNSQDGSGDDNSQRSGGVGSTGVRVHDLNISQIKDYSPSLKTLPPGKSLRAEWKGAPMDLSNDPDLKLLHPAEIHLASVLRLPCEVYLDSKRRLFAEKVHRLRQGLPFRRTDSQKACRIDVNKASRLFGAFEKIGWLEDELFLHHLE